MQNLLEHHWHNLSADEVLARLDSHPTQGLDAERVAHGLRAHGPNRLTPRPGKGPLLRFLLQFHQALVYILLAAVLIKLVVGAWVDAAVIFGVVFLNSVIGFVQESKALAALAALARALTTSATVLRAGQRQRIDAVELVPGDIVLLASGDKVPADLRLLQVRELRLDESALTGESLPVPKRSDPLAADTALADRSNMAYSSTLVSYGSATGVVCATGDATEIGRISTLIANAEVLATPLTRKIAYFSRLLLYAILMLATLTFAAGLWHGGSSLSMFMAAVAMAVAMIPEGLPAVLTITLAIGVARMARRHAIIRHLPAVETLGSTTVICSDKTGTLTRNEMTVQRLWAGGVAAELSGVGYAPEGSLLLDGQPGALDAHPALHELLRAGLLCNDAQLLLDASTQRWRIEGDPTEAALLVAAHKAGLDAPHCSRALPRLDTLAFESEHQYMATLHALPGQPPSQSQAETARIYLKGALEAVLERCHDALTPDGTRTTLDLAAVQAQAEAMARQGLRVLAFARLDLSRAPERSLDHAHVASGLTFLGLQGMIDPPREEAIRAVAACHSAGIQVKMITGDHVLTATAIAERIGLGALQQRAPSARSGRELEALGADELAQTAAQTEVFARVTPEQKLRLVQALQARGEVVAMTGDGVNDAPALRRANIGIAMGINGTEVSKEAADMVLTDDNFASIEAAVEEGRGVFDNLIKFITWILPTNAGQGLVIMAAVLAAQPLPVLPVQALWINMTTAVFLGLALAFEPREAGIMRRPPRRSDAPILSAELLFRIALVGVLLWLGSYGLFEWALQNGYTEAQARTMAVNVFAVGQSFYLLNCRSLRASIWRVGLWSNPWVWVGIATMLTVQLLFTYHPTMNWLFHTAPISAHDWLLISLVGVVIYLVIGAEKRWRVWREAG